MRTLRKALLAGIILLAVFCASLYFFYKRVQSSRAARPLILTPAVINRRLPEANLVNISGETLADERLRRGRAVLVFMMPDCQPCDQENDFLKTLAASRPDVTLIYVIPFGDRDEALKSARSKYAVEPFFDVGSGLSRGLQLYQVPVKVFIEDGIIKRTWPGAALDEREQAEFRDWLSSL